MIDIRTLMLAAAGWVAWGAQAATPGVPVPYYAYITTRANNTCQNQADCFDAHIGVRDPLKSGVAGSVAPFQSTNPLALRLNAQGTRLVIAKGSNDGNNYIWLDVFDTTQTNTGFAVFPVVVDTLTCQTVARDVFLYGAVLGIVIANIDSVDTAIVDCKDGLTLYPVDQAYAQPSPKNRRIAMPANSVFYHNGQLALSEDGKWLFSAGGANANAGVSAIRVADLLAGRFDAAISVALEAREALDGDVAALAVRKTPPTSATSLSRPDDYDLVVALHTRGGTTPDGRVYRIEQRAQAATSNPVISLRTPQVVTESSNLAMSLRDPRAIAISPVSDEFLVFVIDHGKERETQSGLVIDGELIYFALTGNGTTAGNGVVTRLNLTQGVAGYNNGRAAVHPVNIGLSPSGDRLFISETEYMRGDQRYGTFIRTYIIDSRAGANLNRPVLPALPLEYISEENAYGSGSFIGPECAICLKPMPPALAKAKRGRPAATGGWELGALVIIGLFFGWRRAARAA